jgi:hypothetical protein
MLHFKIIARGVYRGRNVPGVPRRLFEKSAAIRPLRSHPIA